LKTLAGAVAAVLIGAGLGYFADGAEPNAADITCDAAAAIVASEACQDGDDASEEADEAPAEAAEDKNEDADEAEEAAE